MEEVCVNLALSFGFSEFLNFFFLSLIFHNQRTRTLESCVTCPEQEMVALTGLNLLDSWFCSELDIFQTQKKASLLKKVKKGGKKQAYEDEKYIETMSDHFALEMPRSLLSVQTKFINCEQSYVFFF